MTPEPEGSSPCSQDPAPAPYPEPTEFTLHTQPISPRSIPISSSHLLLGLKIYALVFQAVPFLRAFPPKLYTSFYPVPCVPTLTRLLILLDLICLMVFGDEYKVRSSSLCNFVHSPVTASFLRPNILLRMCSQAPLVYALPLI
jgi:hypothetical protein